MSKRPLFMAIDPGAGGAIVWYDTAGIAHSEYMPDDIVGLYHLLYRIQDQNFGIRCFVEQVGTYMPGNSGPAAVKFARHCGHLDALLVALAIPHEFVLPRTWQSAIPLTKFPTLPRAVVKSKDSDNERKRELDRRKAVHKAEIKKFMADRYTLIKVTLKNADALGILYWAQQEKATLV